jgi:hypothetical protein
VAIAQCIIRATRYRKYTEMFLVEYVAHLDVKYYRKPPAGSKALFLRIVTKSVTSMGACFLNFVL